MCPDHGERRRGLLLDAHVGHAQGSDDHRLGPARVQPSDGRERLSKDPRVARFREPAYRQLEPAHAFAGFEQRLDRGPTNLEIAVPPETLDLPQGRAGGLVAADRLEQRDADRWLGIFVQPLDRDRQQQIAPSLWRVLDEASHATAVDDQVATIAIDVLLELGHAQALDRKVTRERIVDVAAEDRSKPTHDLGQESLIARLAQAAEHGQGLDLVLGDRGPTVARR